ncbi:MAG: tetratricopeptide repeat protein [Blastocatellia bacterium]
MGLHEVYREEKKHDQALEWAERGVKAFPEQTDSRLRDFLAEEYHRRKRHDEAMALVWAQFIESSFYLENYQKLKLHADRTAEWPKWREQALAFVRGKLTKAQPTSRGSWWGRAGHSELVKIFLWDKDSEAAWREAQEGGCSEDLWVQLAALREKGHPEEALEIYQRQIEPLVNQKNNQAWISRASPA